MTVKEMTLNQKSTWQDVASARRKYRDETIAQVEPAIPDPPSKLPCNVTPIPKDLLSTEEVGITELTPEALVSDLATGKLTSTEVTKAYLRRAGLAQKLVRRINSITTGCLQPNHILCLGQLCHRATS
jgi:amidase